MRIFKSQNTQSKIYADTSAKLAFSVVDAHPLPFAKLVAIPYDENVFNDWEENEYIDPFDATPLTNVIETTTDSMEKATATYLLEKVNAAIIA